MNRKAIIVGIKKEKLTVDEKIFLKSKDIAAFESRAVNFFPEPNEKKLTPSIEWIFLSLKGANIVTKLSCFFNSLAKWNICDCTPPGKEKSYGDIKAIFKCFYSLDLEKSCTAFRASSSLIWIGGDFIK